MYKYTIPRFLQLLFSSLTWKVETRDHAVFLTFDDGPHPRITPWVLEQLSQFNAKATFFCVGENAVKFPGTLQQVQQAGHATGNHTFNHLNGWKTQDDIFFSNVAKCADVLPSQLFRPPYGRLRLSQIRRLKQEYRIVMWDVLSRDYAQDLDTGEAMDVMKRTIGKGSVIVFHDSEKAEKNLKVMLPALLQYLQDVGYEMKSL